MAEVINFFEKVQEKQIKKEESLADDDISSAKIVSKEIFFETMMLLEDLGYDVNENPHMLKDLEALSFLSAALIFRAHGNEHPGTEYLDQAYNVLVTLAGLYGAMTSEGEGDAETDSPF